MISIEITQMGRGRSFRHGGGNLSYLSFKMFVKQLKRFLPGDVDDGEGGGILRHFSGWCQALI